MLILISAASYPSEGSPLSAFVAVLAKEMVRQGIDVTVIAPQPLTTFWKHKIPLTPRRSEQTIDTSEGPRQMTILRPYSFSFGQGRFYKLTLMTDRFVINRAARRLGRKPDIVYSHFWKAADQISDYIAKNNIPSFVATGEDEIIIQRFLSSYRISRLIANTRGVIAVSTKNRDESVKLGLTTEEKTIILPNAVDSRKFYHIGRQKARQILGYTQDDFIVAYCGRFNKRKGALRVSEAINRLNDSRIKSVFIGQEAGADIELPQCEGILFKGSLPHDEIAVYLNAADVFVLPTLAEGCSNAIIEAMACGLPVISSDLPFNKDILNSRNSILVDPLNVAQIADSISSIMNSQSLYQRMSQASLEMAEKLTIGNRVNRILQFIREHYDRKSDTNVRDIK